MNARAVAGRVPWPALAVLASVAAAYALYPYTYGTHHNHAIQIPMLDALREPGLFSGDPFVQAADRYGTLFWPVLAWLTRVIPAEPLFLAGHLATTLAIHAGIFALARALHPGSIAAPYLALWLFLWWAPDIGGESLHWFYWTHTALGYAIGLWCMTLAVRGRLFAAFVLCGALFDVHALQSVYLLAGLVVVAGVEWRWAWRRWVAAAVGWLLAAAPMLRTMIATSAASAPPDLAALLRAFYPQHFYPGSFPPYMVWACALAAALLAYGWRHAPDGVPVRRGRAFAAGVLGFIVVCGLLTALVPAGALLKLHVYRASAYVVIAAIALAAGAAALRFGSARTRGAGFIYAGLVPPLMAQFPPLSDITRDGFVTAVTLSAYALMALAATLHFRHQRLRHALLFVAIALAASATLTGLQLAYGSALNPRHPLHRDGPWVAVQRWAGRHTPPTARFLTPPNLEGFRVYSRRALVGEWKDGAAVMWSADYADYWRNWYLDAGGHFAGAYAQPVWVRLRRAWLHMGPERVLALARRYDAQYVVLESEHYARYRWDQAPLYRNARYLIIAPGSATPEGGR